MRNPEWLETDVTTRKLGADTYKYSIKGKEYPKIRKVREGSGYISEVNLFEGPNKKIDLKEKGITSQHSIVDHLEENYIKPQQTQLGGKNMGYKKYGPAKETEYKVPNPNLKGKWKLIRKTHRKEDVITLKEWKNQDVENTTVDIQKRINPTHIHPNEPYMTHGTYLGEPKFMQYHEALEGAEERAEKWSEYVQTLIRKKEGEKKPEPEKDWKKQTERQTTMKGPEQVKFKKETKPSKKKTKSIKQDFSEFKKEGYTHEEKKESKETEQTTLGPKGVKKGQERLE